MDADITRWWSVCLLCVTSGPRRAEYSFHCKRIYEYAPERADRRRREEQERPRESRHPVDERGHRFRTPQNSLKRRNIKGGNSAGAGGGGLGGGPLPDRRPQRRRAGAACRGGAARRPSPWPPSSRGVPPTAASGLSIFAVSNARRTGGRSIATRCLMWITPAFRFACPVTRPI